MLLPQSLCCSRNLYAEVQVATVTSKCSLLEQERVSMQRMLESRDESGAAVMAGVTKLSDELQEMSNAKFRLKKVV